MIHSGHLAPTLDPAYIVFQAVEPSFCSTADKAKGLYDKMLRTSRQAARGPGPGYELPR